MDTTLTLLVYGGLVFKAAGFFLRDELHLRGLVLCGMAMDVAFQLSLPRIFVPSLISITVLIAINIALIVVILRERSLWLMSSRDRALFAHFKTLTPGQFRALCRTAIGFETTNAERRLLREGTPPDMLYFILGDSFTLEKQGQRFAANGPGFAGEIAFLTNQPSSASLSVPKGTYVVGFDLVKLRRLMARKPDIANGLFALFGQDMARKLSRSAPFLAAGIDTDPPQHAQTAANP